MNKPVANNSFLFFARLVFFFILFFILPSLFPPQWGWSGCGLFAQTVSDTTKAASDTTQKPVIDVEKFFEDNPDTLVRNSQISNSDTLPKKDTLGNLSPVVTPGSLPPTPTDSTAAVPSVPPAEEKYHSFIEMEFVKQKVQHSPDSAFFNVLKITNNNTHPVQGVVRISVPLGWKIISAEETVVNITEGQTEYVPIRVSMDRTASGGTSYIINATFISNRSLFSDKNQNTLTKACYITIPKNTEWYIYPLYRNVYIDRYVEYTIMQLKLSNKGNGSETVKMEFEIGSAIEMYGTLGKKYFTSLELSPHRDTILSFQVKYHPLDESALWNRDFHSNTIKVIASSDSITKRTSVTFKYLESQYYNEFADKQSPLVIDLELQNLLSDVVPRVVFGAQGDIVFKNFNTLDYYLRIPGIALSGYNNRNTDFGTSILRQTRFRTRYATEQWIAMAGDISSMGANMIGVNGRGIAGSYKINRTNTVKGTLAKSVGSPVYSGDVQHEMLLKGIGLMYGLSFILDDYNKMNIYGFSTGASYSFMYGQRVSLLLAATQTQHLYNNQTFTDAHGNFITTNDPNATFYGYGSQMQYNMTYKKTLANINATYFSPHFSQYNNGSIQVNGNGQYSFNQQYSLIGGVNINQYAPKIYNRGILYPERNFLTGAYRTELADRLNQRLTLFAGPYLEHIRSENLIITALKDSIRNKFSTMSPKLSFRLHYKRNANNSITPSLILGYTYITSAQDSFLGNPASSVKSDFFNSQIGLNVLQKYWGMNLQYYYGPHDISTQTTYYYYSTYGKTLRISPYFQKYYFNRTLLLSSYDSYYYDAGGKSNFERISLNARVTFFLDKGWTFYTDNNLFLASNISAEGNRVFSRNYYLGIGVKKIFDIPQPGYKYHNLKIICFKDINGNNIMDNNEHGLSDVVITIDRQAIIDSITKKTMKMPGHFSPAELVTDNFGQIIYYRIPSGEYDLNIIPLFNLKDLYNINGQKQKIRITSDTTYYIPFAQSFKVIGHIILNRDEYSSLGSVSPANVRVTATSEAGNSFFALTANDGSYVLYVPQAGEYKVTVNNIFGEQFVLQEPEYTVSFDGAKEFQVDFIFSEKRRIVNVEGKPTTIEALLEKKPPTFIFIKPGGTSSTSEPSPTPVPTPVPLPSSSSASGISYRVQIGASSSKLSPVQQSQKFNGAENIKEYTEGGVYKYTAGDFPIILDAKKYRDELKGKGFKDAFIIPFKDNKRVTFQTEGIQPDSSSGAVIPAPAISPPPAGISYRVQIASLSTALSPAQQAQMFKGVENVKEYVEGGLYKYAAGGDFTDQVKAEEYKNKLKTMGFKDAFIKKVTSQTGNVEPAPLPNIGEVIPAPVPALTDTAISYRVQILSRSTALSPAQRVQMFKGVENVKEYVEGGLYKYTAGDFTEQSKAEDYKNKLKTMNYKGAFVVRFKNNEKIK